MEFSERLITGFREHFAGREPDFLACAPGRVNLIGEHTDYNDGFVLPIAIGRWVGYALTPRDDAKVRLVSLNFGGEVEFDLRDFGKDGVNSWSNYPRGVAWALQERGLKLKGMDAVLYGDVPLGSGLSSSAAVEVATATAFQAIGDFVLDGVEVALLCQRAENQFVGVNCGIMDQFISQLAKERHALLIDCRSLEYRHVPMPSAEYRFVVADTAKRRGLVDSEYNTRRRECEEAVRFFAERRPQVKALRDVSLDELLEAKAKLDTAVFRRARHVVTENERTLRAVKALEAGNMEAFGELMNASHESLRTDYEVSCSELDAMVEEARRVPGVLGSRMTGAGFGGCTVSLVRADAVEQFLAQVPERYAARTGLKPEVFVFEAVGGAVWRPLREEA
ncbi:MAG: galactokinase [Armatimonadota bacterium]